MSRSNRAPPALLAAMILTASLAPLLAVSASTGAPIATDPEGDAANDGGSASDLVRVGATTNATHLSFHLGLAGPDHPKLIQYRVEFVSAGVTYTAFTSYNTSGGFVSSFVTSSAGTTAISASISGNEVTMSIPRTSIGDPAIGSTLDVLSAETRHGATGPSFDATAGGAYRVGNNAAPVLAPIGAQSVSEDQLLSFTLSGSDADGDAITFTATGLPAGATFNETTLVFSWQPAFDQAGDHVVTFAVSDGSVSDSEDVTITVANTDRAPVLDPVGAQSVNESATLAFTLAATDADGDAITFSATGLPEGATLNATTGAFSWTPAYNQSGAHDVTFTATAGGLSDSELVTITVANVDRAPVLDPISNQSVEENTTLGFTVTASDPDGDAVTLSATGLPVNATFDAATGAFSWTPGYGEAGTYNVTFTATAGDLSDSEEVTITVDDLNRAPVLAAIGNQAVDEDQYLNLTLVATDEDSDALTFSATGLPAGATLDPATGAFSWKPGFDQAGLHNVTFTVGDGRATDSENVTIAVGNVNRPPVLDPIGAQSVNENQLLSFVVTGSDPDGDATTLSAAGLPWGASFNATTGAFSWTPGYNQSGPHDVTFTATAGDLSDSEVVTITVANVNRAPVLEEVGSFTVNETETLSLVLNGTDPDGDVLAYTSADLPAGATLDAATGAFSWTPGYNQSGLHEVTLVASDGDGANDTVVLSVTVLDVNQPPVLDPIADVTVLEGAFVSINLSAADGDLDALAYAVDPLPAGATFDAATGAFAWQTTTLDAGVYALNFSVTDGEATVHQIATLTVQETAAPVLAPVEDKFVTEAQTLSFTLSATDADNDPLTFSATGLPEGATLNAATGAFSWTPNNFQAGEYLVTFRVSDGTTEDTDDALLIVLEDNGAPILDAIGTRNVNEGALLSFTTNATDPDADVLTFSAAGLPEGASYDAATGAFQWRPNFTQAGTYSVTFSVTDGSLSDSETVSIVVAEKPNEPPTFGSIVVPARVDVFQTFNVAANNVKDPDGAGVVSIEWDFNASDGFQSQRQGASTFWAYQKPGEYTVTIRATDADGLSNQTTVQVSVDDPVSLSLEVPLRPTLTNGGTAQGSLRAWNGSGIAGVEVTLRILYSPTSANGPSHETRSFTVTTDAIGTFTVALPRDTDLVNLPGRHFLVATAQVPDTVLGDTESASARVEYRV